MTLEIGCQTVLQLPSWRLFRSGIGLLLGMTLFSAAALAQIPLPCPPGTVTRNDVTTYHNDAQRTGWNKQETSLKPCNVDPRSFGLIAAVKDINGQIDAQPLVVTNQEVESAQGVRKLYEAVVYVVTSTNSVYAIDGANGNIINERTLGIPVDQTKLPGYCGNNAPSIGISSTPVIDLNTSTMYAVAYLLEDDKAVYRIFALDLIDLSLKVKPAPVIKASHALANGNAYHFDPTVSRQRSGLLLVNGNVYAAFASFCDFRAELARGWVLGWQTKDSLKPLPQNQLNDLRSNTSGIPNYFLSSIWMSGYGIAADEDGSSLYFITGNSDEKGPFQIGKATTLEESVVRMRGDLTDVVDWFTPSDPIYGVRKLDSGDLDFGSGGVLVVPGGLSGSIKHLAVAAGKVGQMYLLDRDNMGKYDLSGTNHVLDTVDIGKCWCGQSYFVGPDGVGRIVSSGDPHFKVWKVTGSPSPKLSIELTSPVDLGAGGFQKGFFTSISSDLQRPETAIIWAVRRPTDTITANLTLYAFDAADGKLLYSAPAGTWPRYRGAAANVVATVTNGKVYVASNGELRIFGIGGQAAPAIVAAAQARTGAAQNDTYSGSIIRVDPTRVWLDTVQEGILEIDIRKAQQEGLSVHLEPGEPITVRGPRLGNAVEATSIYHGLSNR
jgi:outer membrane protein assembly factor BamB